MSSMDKLCITVLLAMVGLTEGVMVSPNNWNSSLALPTTATPSAALNVSMCAVLGDDFSTACSCMDLFNSRATTYATTVTGAMTETGQYAYKGYYSTRPTTIPYSDTLTTVVMTDSGYTPPDNCCADWCQIDAGSVRILYWPVGSNGTNGTEVSNMSITASPEPFGVVSAGMTFTSPSVYVAYTNINAHKVCGSFDNIYLGKNYNTTIAYAPTALSTSKGATPDQMAAQEEPNQYTAINYTDLQAYSLPDQPVFSLPYDLSNINPKWAKCFPAAYGAFDPPRTLARATALIPSIPSDPAAAPAAQAIPVTGTATAPPLATAGDWGSGVKTFEGSALPIYYFAAFAHRFASRMVPEASSTVISTGIQASGGSGASKGGPDVADPMDGASGGVAPVNADPHPVSGSSGSGSSSLVDPATGSSQEDPAPASIAGQPVITAPNNGIIVGTSINTPGSQVQISDIAVSIGNGQNIANGISHALPPSSSPTPPRIADLSIQKLPNGDIIAAASTIPPGNVATVSNHIISAGSSFALIDGTTLTPSPSPTPIPISIANQPLLLAPNNGGVILAGSTIPPGSVATISNHVVSAGASYAVVDGSTLTPSPSPTPISIANQPLRLAPNDGGVILAGSTIPPGSVATISNHVISAGISYAIVDGTTAVPDPDASPQIITFANGAVASAGGGAITVSGSVYSVLPGDGGVVVNGQTEPLATVGVGGVVVGGLGAGNGDGGGNASAPLVFVGRGGRVRSGLWRCGIAVLGGMVWRLVAVM